MIQLERDRILRSALACSVCWSALSSVSGLWTKYEGTKEFPYFPKAPFCGPCAAKAERAFIEGLQLEELPLWMGHEWLYAISDVEYRSRLKELEGEPRETDTC